MSGQSLNASPESVARTYVPTRSAPNVAMIFLSGTAEVLAQRLAGRSGHYMPPSLLDSQLATLEPPQADEDALTLDIRHAPDELLRQALAWLEPSGEA